MELQLLFISNLLLKSPSPATTDVTTDVLMFSWAKVIRKTTIYRKATGKYYYFLMEGDKRKLFSCYQ